MDDITSAELSAPLLENYEGRIAPDQQRRIKKVLKRQGAYTVLSMLCIFGYPLGVTFSQIYTSPHETFSKWLSFAGINFAPFLVVYLILLLIERRELARLPLLRRSQRELRQGRVVQGEGELSWRDHRYALVVGERNLFALDATIHDLLPGRYRFFYLPQSGLLIAAESLGEPFPHYSLLINLGHAQGFSAAAVAANRAGEEGPVRGRTTREDTRVLVVFLGCLMVALVLGVIVLIAIQPAYPSPYPFPPYPDYGAAPAESSSSATVALMLALVALVFAIPLLIALPALAGRRFPRLNLSLLLKKQQVLAAEDIASKSVRDADYLPVYTMEVGGRQFAIQKATYLALDTSLRYRVYYLSRGNRLLSMEPLASEAAPAAV